MCMIVVCQNSKCQKKTWTGCGKHLSTIFNGVKDSDLCKCDMNKYLKIINRT